MNNFSFKASDEVIAEGFALLDTFSGDTKAEKFSELLRYVRDKKAAENIPTQGRFATQLACIANAMDVVKAQCNALAADADLQINTERTDGLKSSAEIRKINENLQSKCRAAETERMQQSEKIVELEAENAELKENIAVAKEQVATLTASLKNYGALSAAYERLLARIEISSGETDQNGMA